MEWEGGKRGSDDKEDGWDFYAYSSSIYLTLPNASAEASLLSSISQFGYPLLCSNFQFLRMVGIRCTIEEDIIVPCRA